jgi:hypothetical protein
VIASSLVGRIVRERQVVIVPLLLGVLLNVLGYFIVVRPLGIKFAGAADRAVAASNGRKAAEKELTLAQALVAGKADADRELGAFYQKVLPADVTAARRMTYASLPALARQSDVQLESRTTMLDEGKDDARFGHMAIRMVLQGDYANLRRFIYALERAEEFVIIDDVTLAESNASDPIMLTLNLSTYYKLVPSGS